jgi:transglutaminase-like putative cysteine protease
MIYEIQHHTIYRYSQPVVLSHHALHMKPRTGPHQQWVDFHLDIFPRPSFLTEKTDYFGNTVHYFSIQDLHGQLEVRTSARLEVHPSLPAHAPQSLPWEQVRRLLAAPSAPDDLLASQFCFPSPFVPLLPELTDYALESFPPGRPVLAGASDLCARIHRDFVFDPVATTVSTPIHEVWTHRRGVCQDFAHLALACLRGLGLAAKYVSGYLETDPPPGQQKLAGADASHAWFSVYSPGYGWADYDPTNNLNPAGRHITIGWGRDYDDVSPLRGVIVGGGQHSLEVGVDVRPAL